MEGKGSGVKDTVQGRGRQGRGGEEAWAGLEREEGRGTASDSCFLSRQEQQELLEIYLNATHFRTTLMEWREAGRGGVGRGEAAGGPSWAELGGAARGGAWQHLYSVSDISLAPVWPRRDEL